MDHRGKRVAAALADVLLAFSAPLVLRVFTRRERPTGDPRRILVVRADHIGDVAMATPALARLRRAFPDAVLEVVTGPWGAELLPVPSLVDHVHPVSLPWWLSVRGATWRTRLAGWLRLPGAVLALRRRRFDLAVDLRGDLRQIVCLVVGSGAPVRVSSTRTGGKRLLTAAWPHDPALHEVAKGCAVADLAIAQWRGGGHVSSPAPYVPTPSSAPLQVARRPLAASHAAAVSSALVGRRYVALIGRGNAAVKHWSPSAITELVRQLAVRQGVATVAVGGPSDLAVGNAVEAAGGLSLVGRCSLTETVDVLSNAAVVVAVDTGPMHLAAATGRPVVALFGPTSPEYYSPWTDRVTLLGPQAPCGCRGRHCVRASPHADAVPCMLAITVPMVIGAVELWLTTCSSSRSCSGHQ